VWSCLVSDQVGVIALSGRLIAVGGLPLDASLRRYSDVEGVERAAVTLVMVIINSDLLLVGGGDWIWTKGEGLP
jgi:hypothetical protein